jgi:uncharacterized repeat protein (TIGR03806 family)
VKRLLLGAAALAVVAAVWSGFRAKQDAPQPVPHFAADGLPGKLSDWGMLAVSGTALKIGQGVVPYDLATPLFTDYAGKLRLVYVPKGQHASYDAVRTFDFPVGTIIAKTFYYPLPESGEDGHVLRAVGAALQSGATGLDLTHVRLIETRILARRDSGWVALPYVWNDEQTDAVLMRTGKVVRLTLDGVDGASEPVAYAVPNVNQCASCHTTDNASRQLSPIGPKARHLNRIFDYAEGAENQLAHWQRIGILAGAPAPSLAPRNVSYLDTSAPLAERARAYLDINCSHCHSATGLARTTGLQLDANVVDIRRLGACKPPVAAGQGTGNRIFDVIPGKPDQSIMVYRIGATEPGIRMPEAGRSVVHAEGLDLIRQWIASLPGNCSS